MINFLHTSTGSPVQACEVRLVSKRCAFGLFRVSRTLRVPRAVPTGSRPQGSGGAAVPTQARRVFLTGRERSAATSSTGICLQSARRCVLAQGHSVAASLCAGACLRCRLLRSMRQLASGSGSGTPSHTKPTNRAGLSLVCRWRLHSQGCPRLTPRACALLPPSRCGKTSSSRQLVA
jgi:hypothetical protein